MSYTHLECPGVSIVARLSVLRIVCSETRYPLAVPQFDLRDYSDVFVAWPLADYQISVPHNAQMRGL